MSGAWNLGNSKALSFGGERVRQWWSHRDRASLALPPPVLLRSLSRYSGKCETHCCSVLSRARSLDQNRGSHTPKRLHRPMSSQKSVKPSIIDEGIPIGQALSVGNTGTEEV